MPKDFDLFRQRLEAVEADLLKDFTERNLERLHALQQEIAAQVRAWEQDTSAPPDRRLRHRVALAILQQESRAMERCFALMDWTKPGEWRQFLDDDGGLTFLDEHGELRPEWTVQDKTGAAYLHLPDSESQQRGTEMNLIHWPKVQELAQELWQKEPAMNITQVAEHQRILTYLNEHCGRTFSASHRRRIVSAVAPATVPGPGRPKTPCSK